MINILLCLHLGLVRHRVLRACRHGLCRALFLVQRYYFALSPFVSLLPLPIFSILVEADSDSSVPGDCVASQSFDGWQPTRNSMLCNTFWEFDIDHNTMHPSNPFVHSHPPCSSPQIV